MILREFSPSEYHVIDTNEYGLSLLSSHLPAASPVRIHHCNALNPPAALTADVVFSVGLIEHFDKRGTANVVRAHLELLRPGGCAVISFPTPTLLYRISRRLVEAAGLWKFLDERPLMPEEVREALVGRVEVLHEETLWPLILTQRLIVARKIG